MKVNYIMWDLCNFISSNFPAKTNQLLSRDSYDNNRNQVKKERGDVKEYFESIKRRDPAARNIIQIILLYPGARRLAGLKSCTVCATLLVSVRL